MSAFVWILYVLSVLLAFYAQFQFWLSIVLFCSLVLTLWLFPWLLIMAAFCSVCLYYDPCPWLWQFAKHTTLLRVSLPAACYGCKLGLLASKLLRPWFYPIQQKHFGHLLWMCSHYELDYSCKLYFLLQTSDIIVLCYQTSSILLLYLNPYYIANATAPI